jgi:hypothetical protein
MGLGAYFSPIDPPEPKIPEAGEVYLKGNTANSPERQPVTRSRRL